MTASSASARARISQALDRVRLSHAAERISLGELLDALGDHGFGLLILALALLNALPGPHIPGFSTGFAIGLVVVGAQIALGWPSPRIPRRARRWSVTSAGFSRFLDRALPSIRRIEAWLRLGPRPSWLTEPVGQRLIGVAVILLSIVLALPVPFGNAPIAWALMVLALGLMEEDSRALGFGLGLGVLAVVWNAALIAGGALAILELLGYAV